MKDKLINLLSAAGFLPANQLKDFDQEIPYVYYCVRLNESHNKINPFFEYVSLIFYEEQFCEAVYEHYLTPKNSKRTKGNLKNEQLWKGGFAPFRATILRSEQEIIERISKVII